MLWSWTYLMGWIFFVCHSLMKNVRDDVYVMNSYIKIHVLMHSCIWIHIIWLYASMPLHVFSRPNGRNNASCHFWLEFFPSSSSLDFPEGGEERREKRWTARKRNWKGEHWYMIWSKTSLKRRHSESENDGENFGEDITEFW